MHDALLDLLRCPFCGTRLSLIENRALRRHGPDVEAGVLGCECCAFPIVAGIPVLVADDATREAMHALETGRHGAALFALLGLQDPDDADDADDDDDRTDRFRTVLARGAEHTYQQTLEVLSPDAEGTYFLYRFSDPTFLTAEAVVHAVGLPGGTGPVLDLCGGSGHLTRTLAGLGRSGSVASLSPTPRPPYDTVLADRHFWKLWLARRFTAPGCAAVCCDADAPLPFTRDLFSVVVMADAFPYIWHKRLCADEMMRVVTPDGVVVMPHLHSALGENISAGNTLTPGAYRDLFAAHHPQLFSEARLFDDILERRIVDLERGLSPTAIGTESALTLIACPGVDGFRRYPVSDPVEVTGNLVVNPLYGVERRQGASILTLRFPTPEYEEEFGACRRYLPDTVTVEADLTGHIEPTMLGTRYQDLRRRRVLLDAPPRYC